jgi:hypothetical protein
LAGLNLVMDYEAVRAALLLELERYEAAGKTDRADQVRAQIDRYDTIHRRNVPADPVEEKADSQPLERAVPRGKRRETR